MVTYVLDSSAVLRYLAGEAGAARVAEILKAHVAGRCEAIISALHWGEIAGILCKRHGNAAMEVALSRLRAFGLEVVPADGDQAIRAALIKLKRRIHYADSFGTAITAAVRDRMFVTADFDFKPASSDVKIEFLPPK